MEITETIEYAASPEAVYAMLTDPEFQKQKCVDLDNQHYDSAVTPAGDGARVVTHREDSTDGMPGAVRSFVGDALKITETYEWAGAGPDGSRTADLLVEVAGAPVAMRARVQLVPEGQGSRLRLAGDLKASIPLVGRKVEKSAAPAIVHALRSEAQTGRRWLAEGS